MAGQHEQSFLARTFEHRSGRIIALCRGVLAAVFFLALWVDPGQPVRSSTAGYVLLFGYLVLAAFLLILAWRSWWWDSRLARPMHAVDIAAFLAAVYFTETTGDDFTSPFLAFFAFLMLSATIRWDWRVTALTGIAVTALYLLVGLAMSWLGIELELLRFGRRVIYMLVLSLILIWFGLQRREQHVGRFTEPPGSAEDRLPPMLDALRYAMAESGAQSGALAWAHEEEPHVEIRSLGLDCVSGRLPPDILPVEAPFASSVRLYDTERRRSLQAGQRNRWKPVAGPVEDPFAVHCGLREGLALPFTAVTGRGEVLLGGIPGASADHVEIGEMIAREIGAAFDRQATMSLVREGALTRVRDAVARDLHDTIAQSIAGVSLRLEGLRQWIRGGGDPESEIQAIKTALRAEQSQVRTMIERLRRGDSAVPGGPARASLAPLLCDLESYWGISTELDDKDAEVLVTGGLAHELRQLLREAVANAVRHGGARHLKLTIFARDDMLHLQVADNGRGFPDDGPVLLPRSISERVAELGGSLAVKSAADGAVLRFVLPLESSR